MSGTQSSPQKYSLMNDSIDTIPLMAADAAGDMVALPPGRTPTVVNGDPASLNAVIDGTNLVLNALVPAATNISLEVDDGSLQPFFLSIDIVEDVAPVSVMPNLAAVTHATQPRPSAPASGGGTTGGDTGTGGTTGAGTGGGSDTTGGATSGTDNGTGTVTAPGDTGAPTPGPADTTQPAPPTTTV